MKKTILAGALVAGMALPMILSATTASALDQGIIQNLGPDGGWVWSNTNRTSSNCPRLKRIHNDDRAEIVKRGRGRSYEHIMVRMLSGECQGWSGWIWQHEWRTIPKVFTGGRWGNEVPVFRDRGTYFSARYSMDRNGHYRNQSGRVICKLRIGTQVRFKPFKDWGVGEVWAGNCSGWIDRGVIR